MQEGEGEDSLLGIFLAEAEEIIGRLKSQVVELEDGFDSQGLLDQIHRGFHTLYGGGRVLDIEAIGDLSLSGADIIQQLRGPRSPLTPRTLGLIKALVDTLGQMINALQKGDTLPLVDEDFRRRLQQAGERTRAGAAGSALPNSEAAPVSEQRRASAMARPAESPMPGAPVVTESLPDFSAPLDDRVADDHDELGAQRIAEELEYFSRELSWVRDLLMQLQDGGSPSERRRALQFLDLLATDVEGWSRRSRLRFRKP